VAFCIHGGDLFDVPVLPDFSMLNNIIPELKRLQKAGIDFYINLGSHDVFGYNTESVYKTAVGSLIRYGLLKIPKETEVLSGVPFQFINAKLNHTAALYKDIQPKFIVSHNMLVPERVPYDHVLLADVPGRDKIFLCGHYHLNFAKKIGTNIFINPGPLIRTSIVEADNKPSISIISYDGALKLYNVVVPHKLKVFDLTDITRDREENFSLTVKNTKFEFYDLFELATKLGQDNNVPLEVVNEVIRRINDAKAGLHT